jgi:hypothetical protein
VLYAAIVFVFSAIGVHVVIPERRQNPSAAFRLRSLWHVEQTDVGVEVDNGI